MAIAVETPKLGTTVEECVVTKWRKKAGEIVAQGDVVVEIETDKATFEVTAPAAGTLLEIFFDEGALVPVFTALCVIGEPGEDVAALRPRAMGLDTQGLSEAPAATATASAHESHAEPEAASVPALSPRASRFAREHGFFPLSIRGSGPGGRVLEEDVRRAYFESLQTE